MLLISKSASGWGIVKHVANMFNFLGFTRILFGFPFAEHLFSSVLGVRNFWAKL